MNFHRIDVLSPKGGLNRHCSGMWRSLQSGVRYAPTPLQGMPKQHVEAGAGLPTTESVLQKKKLDVFMYMLASIKGC